MFPSATLLGLTLLNYPIHVLTLHALLSVLDHLPTETFPGKRKEKENKSMLEPHARIVF